MALAESLVWIAGILVFGPVVAAVLCAILGLCVSGFLFGLVWLADKLDRG